MHKKIISLCLGFITFSNAYGANNVVSIRQNDPYENTFKEPSEEVLKNFEIAKHAKAANRRKKLGKLNKFSDSTLLSVTDQLQALLPHINVQTVSERTAVPNDSLPKNIQNMQEEIKNLVNYTKDLNNLAKLESNDPNTFKNAMTSDFSLQMLQIIIKRLQTSSNQSVLSNLPNTKDHVLTALLKYCTKEDLEKINPDTGQNIVHQFTPFHWLADTMNCLAQKARLDIPTQDPDIHPGSTIFHSVAHQVSKKEQYPKNHGFKDHIKTAMTFLITHFNNGYAHVLVRESKSNTKQITCWQALPPKYQQKIYDALTQKAILEIYHEIYEQETNHQITKEVANFLRAAFPVKI